MARRAELLVEDFFDDLKPARFLQAEGGALEFDFVVAFEIPKKGLEYFAVEVKATEKTVGNFFNFITGRRILGAQKSNMHPLVMVVDTKRDELHFGFLSKAEIVNSAHRAGLYEVSLPVKKIENSKQGKKQFLSEILTAV